MCAGRERAIDGMMQGSTRVLSVASQVSYLCHLGLEGHWGEARHHATAPDGRKYSPPVRCQPPQPPPAPLCLPHCLPSCPSCT